MIRVVALLMTLFISLPAYAEKWDEGGFLHGGPLIDWKIANGENALASSADYLKWSTAPDKLKQVSDAELKQVATAVMDCMRNAAQIPGSRKDDSDKVMMACLAQAKPSHDWVLTKPLEKENVWAMEEEADSSEQPEFIPTSPLSYATVEMSRDERRAIGRTKLSVRIVLAERNGKKLIEPRSQDKITARRRRLWPPPSITPNSPKRILWG